VIRLAARSHHLNHDPLKHCSENDACVNMEVRARVSTRLCSPAVATLKRRAAQAGRPSQPGSRGQREG